MKPIGHFIAGCVILLIGVLLWSPPVAAHTGFESSDPADGSVTSGPVDTITLVFSGDAEPTGDGFLILDADGAVREPAEASTVDGRTWILRFDPPVGGGSVGVRWMVRAPDAHPIDGAFSFSAPGTSASSANAPASDVAALGRSGLAGGSGVSPDQMLEGPAAQSTSDAPPVEGGSPPNAAALVNEVVVLEDFLNADDGAGPASGGLGASGRFVVLVGSLVGIGGLTFAATVMRGRRRDVRYVLVWVRRAGLVVVAGALMEFAAQVANEAAGSWTALWSPSAVGGVVASTFGVSTVLRVVGGIALAGGAQRDTIAASEVADPVVAMRKLVSAGVVRGDAGSGRTDVAHDGESHAIEDPLVRPGDHAWLAGRRSTGAALGVIAILAAYLFDGHTVTKGNRLVTAVVDIIHVAGSAIWAGGVLMLAVVLWHRHREGQNLRARQLALRFSVVATAALVVVGLAGVILTIIVLDRPSELWTTDWGRILIAKTTFVGIAAAAGGYNHKVLIPALDTAPNDAALSFQLRNIVTAEALALLTVAVATAFLMGAAS